MADREREHLVGELGDRLVGLGLTEYEARTLIALVRLGTATAREVADADGVPRTRVYEAAESLHDRGLVDIQYTTPREFSAVDPDTVVEELRTAREETLTEVSELFERLGTAEPASEQVGAWTVTGSDAVARRVMEFVDGAEREVVLLSVEDLLAGALLERLVAADERGVEIHVGDRSAGFRDRVREAVPSAEVFGTDWDWTSTPTRRVLLVDGRTALVSTRLDERGPDAPDEVAIWGRGERNGVVVAVRMLVATHLDALDPSG